MADLIKDIVTTIEKSVESFNGKVPAHQQRVLDEVTVLLKELELQNGSIKQSVKNLKLIGKIKSKLERIVTGTEWQKDVKEYLQAFNDVTKLQNKYFGSLAKEFKPTPLLGEIRKQSLDSALESLTENGINSAVTDKVQDLLRKAITSGSKYTDTLGQLRDLLTDTETGPGALQRYTKQIATDALNQYSAQYANAVTSDLGLEWYMYTGALIETSRTFCVALVKKKYIHKSELADVIAGNFKEFEDLDGEINPRTDLPQGMIPRTDVNNFHIYRGGYQCGHQLLPVDEVVVPVVKRIEVYNRKGIRHINGVKLAA